jgi:hypothetical protein
VPRDGLGHVPGARRPQRFRVGECEGIARAAQLERADRLQVLELQEDLGRAVVLERD